ncbi:MAG: helix-turn-helix transcriptional regulator [Nocardioidaceae bacterium]
MPSDSGPEPWRLRSEALLAALRRARDLVDRHYAEPLDLDDLARAAGYSRFHFARAFRTVYGETPGRYLTRRRIERAAELLRWANLTVTEVCQLVGFSSLGSFSTAFRDFLGTSPAQFQRDAHRSGPPPIPGCYVLMFGVPAARAPRSAISEKSGTGSDV